MGLLDSYDLSNRNDYEAISGGQYFNATGQSFEAPSTKNLDGVKFALWKFGSPTGSAYVKLYAHDGGTFGTNGRPTGSPLATSEPFDVSILSTTAPTTFEELATFLFKDTDIYELQSGTKYFVVIEYTGGDASNYIYVGMDSSSPSDDGNVALYHSPSWTSASDEDLIFYTYAIEDRYWVGGGGNWYDTSSWAASSGGSSGASIPTEFDNVTIDSNSGFGSGGTITLNGSYWSCKCRDFTANSGHSYTIAYSTSDIEIYGDFTNESGLTWDSSTWTYLLAHDTGHTITSNGCTINYLLLGDQNVGLGINGGWTLQDDIVLSDNLYIENGVFTVGTNNVTSNGLEIHGDVGNTPTVNMGSGTWTVDGDTEILDYDTNGHITLNAQTSLLKLVGNHTYVIYEDSGNFELYDLELVGSTYFGYGVDLHDLILTAPSGGGYSLGQGETYNLSGTLYANGSPGNIITISSTYTSAFYIVKTSGTVEVSYCNISYSEVSGGATFKAINSTDSGNNTGWLFIKLLEISETVLMAETTLSSISRSLSETLIVSEVFSALKVVWQQISDTIDTADTILQTITRELSETITVSESLIKGSARVLNEEVSLDEVISTSLAYIRELTEGLSLSEVLGTGVAMVLSENITLTDLFVRTFGVVKTETLNVYNQLIMSFNGIVTALWAKVSKDTDAWSAQSKDTTGDSFSPETLDSDDWTREPRDL